MSPIVTECSPLLAKPVQGDVYGIRRQAKQSGYLAVPVASRCENSKLFRLRLALYNQQRDEVSESFQAYIARGDGLSGGLVSTSSSSGHGQPPSSSAPVRGVR